MPHNFAQAFVNSVMEGEHFHLRVVSMESDFQDGMIRELLLDDAPILNREKSGIAMSNIWLILVIFFFQLL